MTEKGSQFIIYYIIESSFLKTFYEWIGILKRWVHTFRKALQR